MRCCNYYATIWKSTVWKGHLKTKLCVLVDYSYHLEFFNILAIGQKYPSFYGPCFFNIDRVINFETFVGKQFLVDDTGLQKIRLTLLYLSLLVYFQLCIYL